MRDAAGELAHRLHLLRLAELVLGGTEGGGGGPLGGDVAAHRMDQPLGRHRGPGNPVPAAVLVPVAVLEAQGGEALAQAAGLDQGRLVVLGMHEVEEAAAHEVCLSPAELAGPGRVDRGDGAVEVGDQHHVLRQQPDPVALPGAFHHPALERGIDRTQRRLGPALLVDVDVHADPGPQLAVRAQQRDVARHGPAVAAGVVAQPVGMLEGAAPGDAVAPQRGGGRPVLGVDRLGPAVAAPFRLRLAGEGTPGWAVAHRQPLGVGGPDDLGRGLDQGPEPRLALAHRLGGRLALRDVDDRADVAEVLAGVAESRRRRVDHRGIAAVAPAQPVVDLERVAGGVVGEEGGVGRGLVVRMDGGRPAEALAGAGWLAGEFVPATVEVGGTALRIGGPDHHRGMVGHVAEAGLALAHRRLRLGPLAVGEHLAGGLGAGAEHPGDAAGLVAQRAVAEGVPGILGIAVPLHDQVQVLDPGRLAVEGAADQRADVVPDLGPDLPEGPAERRRMAGAEDGPVAVVVEETQLLAPGEEHGLARFQHQLRHDAQAAGPALGRAEGAPAPVQGPDGLGHAVAAAGHPGQRGRGGRARATAGPGLRVAHQRRAGRHRAGLFRMLRRRPGPCPVFHAPARLPRLPVRRRCGVRRASLHPSGGGGFRFHGVPNPPQRQPWVEGRAAGPGRPVLTCRGHACRGRAGSPVPRPRPAPSCGARSGCAPP